MPERLGLGLIPGAGWRADEIRTVAREAEKPRRQGSTPSFRLRSHLCKIGSAHCRCDGWENSARPRRQSSTGKPCPRDRDALTRAGVAKIRGRGSKLAARRRTDNPSPAAAVAIPGANLSGSADLTGVELAGEIASGVMPLLWSPERVSQSRRWAERGRSKSGSRDKLDMTLGLPTFIGDDMDGLRATARMNL
jgi:hypothetical protein